MENRVVVMKVADDMLGDFYRSVNPMLHARQLRRTGNYRRAAEFVTHQSGEAAAEEAFDISNNPSRENLRQEVFGRQRSVSVGDIVEVNGEEFFCAAMGWQKMS
jgi:peptide methionine sulfoxide reductase MsrA